MYIIIRGCPDGKPCFLYTLLLKISLPTGSVMYVYSNLDILPHPLKYTHAVFSSAVKPCLPALAIKIWPHCYYSHFNNFGQNKSSVSHFLFKEPFKYGYPVNTATFLWPVGDWINGVPLYCTFHTKLAVVI